MKLTTYKLIPGKESEVCGVIYAQAIATFSDGNKMEVTKRKSEILLENKLEEMHKKYKVPVSEIKSLKDLIEKDASQSADESNIE